LVAEARVSVVHLGPDRRPAEIPAEIRSRSLELPVSASLAATGTRRSDWPTRSFAHTFRVRPTDIDVFHHVNHARYLDYAEDLRMLGELAGALPGWTPGRGLAAVSIDYAREALVRDELTAEALVLSATEMAWRLRRGDTLLTAGRLRVQG
jgi:acyl-CoA thioesterase FadM